MLIQMMPRVNPVQEVVVFDLLGPGYDYMSLWGDEKAGAAPGLWRSLGEEGITYRRDGKPSMDLIGPGEVQMNFERAKYDLNPVFGPTLLELRELGYGVVVMSSSDQRTIDQVMGDVADDLAQRIERELSPEDLVNAKVATEPFGPKSDPNTWRNVLQSVYGDEQVQVVGVYEDSVPNGLAAMAGLNALDFHFVTLANREEIYLDTLAIEGKYYGE